ncbi:MAG: SGNH/GDSL hydrolase family protein [Chitinophagales bacterium]|nr:SGNH/GDSL hydrolase family protein [Chitinophagales bacterium]
MFKRLVKYALVLVFSFLILEFLLMLLDFKPGKLFNFDLSDKAVVKQSNLYCTDNAGIYKLNRVMLDSLRQFSELEGISGFEDLDSLFFYSKAMLANSTMNDLGFCCNPKFDLEDTIFQEYLRQPINAEGFRSIAFKRYEGIDKLKILLIGDSFAWGLSARPIFNSYSDLLLGKDYLVYNTGISGTDPAQYAAIAEKYIPMLQPDLVIVNFYLGNDFMSFPRSVEKDKVHEYYTNLGFLDSYPAGEFLSFEQAIVFYKSISALPPNSFFNSFCSKTRVGTHLLWKTLFALSLVKHPNLSAYYTIQDRELMEKAEITKEYISRINKICKDNEIECLNTIIPEVPFVWNKASIIKNEGKYKLALDLVFQNIPYSFPTSLSAKDYSSNGHFNNMGNEKYALFLDEEIQKIRLAH